MSWVLRGGGSYLLGRCTERQLDRGCPLDCRVPGMRAAMELDCMMRFLDLIISSAAGVCLEHNTKGATERHGQLVSVSDMLREGISRRGVIKFDPKLAQ